MRTRSLAVLSAAALSAILLAGCTPSAEEASPSPSVTAGADLCGALVPSGAASEAVTVEGEPGTESIATFTAPLDVTELQTTVLEEGEGDPLESGDLAQFALSAFDATTGDKLGAQGYNDDLLPQAISADSVLGQAIGCAKPGARFVTTFPATEDGQAAQVYIIDVFGSVPAAAWGDPQDPVDGMPTVELAEDGSPTVTLPEGDIPTEFSKATLKEGDGAVVEVGDQVLVQYHGVSWNTGEMFDESWGKQPFPFSTSGGVVQGFADAVIGETVGSQVIAVLPPSVAYGEGEITDADLKGQTLVFVIDILGVAHPAPAAQ